MSLTHQYEYFLLGLIPSRKSAYIHNYQSVVCCFFFYFSDKPVQVTGVEV